MATRIRGMHDDSEAVTTKVLCVDVILYIRHVISEATSALQQFRVRGTLAAQNMNELLNVFKLSNHRGIPHQGRLIRHCSDQEGGNIVVWYHPCVHWLGLHPIRW